jgi:hypothetical protein
MDQEQLMTIYLAARKNGVMDAKDIDDAERLVRETQQPVVVYIPTLVIGREHRERVECLVREALEKGVVVQADEASFLETMAERHERAAQSMRNGRKCGM